MAYCAVLFFAPELGGVFLEGNNFIPADPFQTPQHIAPLWYFTPYYSILRATTAEFMIWLAGGTAVLAALICLRLRGIWAWLAVALVAAVAIVLMIVPNVKLDPKLWGVMMMGLSVTVFAALPWLDQSPVKSIRYRPFWHRIVIGVFVVAFVTLGYLGINPPTPTRTLVAQVCAGLYFGFFFLMPWWSRMGTFKPVPDRVKFKGH
jgi:ubiquinol-cytochrome c reductase cytochrome b subunit